MVEREKKHLTFVAQIRRIVKIRIKIGGPMLAAEQFREHQVTVDHILENGIGDKILPHHCQGQ